MKFLKLASVFLGFSFLFSFVFGLVAMKWVMPSYEYLDSYVIPFLAMCIGIAASLPATIVFSIKTKMYSKSTVASHLLDKRAFSIVIVIGLSMGALYRYPISLSGEKIVPQSDLNLPTGSLSIDSIKNEAHLLPWSNFGYICKFNFSGETATVLALGTDDIKSSEKYALLNINGVDRILSNTKSFDSIPEKGLSVYKGDGFKLIYSFESKICAKCDGPRKHGEITLTFGNKNITKKIDGFCAY